MKTCTWRIVLVAVTVASILTPQATTGAYSVFTHEELIDLTWRSAIRPLLLERYPGSTDAQLREAHAFAYGGCAAQDLGYYPFGNKFFSELTHYVRAGDFINNLFRESRNVDEYAFAIGALSHYIGDSIGHSVAVNPSTGINFPGLAKKYGPVVTYDESPHAHVRTEYAFDIGQLSKRTFAPPAFMRFIGFKVPRALLKRAFVATYGIEVRELVGKTRPAMKSYRASVRTLIPIFSNAEIVLHGKQFAPDTDDAEYQQFVKQLRQADYERHWAYTYRNPGIGSHLLAIVIKIIPKIGPASYLAIKIPDAQTEGWYIQSVNRSADDYRRLLENLRANPTMALDLPNRDLDTGARVKAGDYALTDDTYANLVDRLASDPSRTIPDGLRENILEYYGDLSAPISTKKNPRKWKKLMSELQVIAGMKSGEAAATPSE